MQLHIQQRSAPGKLDFDPKPEAVQRWITALPMVNTGETTRLLYQSLGGLNQMDMAPAQRFRVLELLRSPVFYVLDVMKKHVVGQTFPLNEKARKIARLTQELLREMGDGYKIVVMAEVSGNGLRRDTRTLNTALHRAMQCLSQQLLKAYQVYSPHPEDVWSDIHQLYQYAETHALHGGVIGDVPESGASASSIELLYRQILLLALACPYRMRQGEVEQVHGRLQQWAVHSRLSPMARPGQPAGLFMVNLGIDEPPTYLSLRHGGTNEAQCRVLDTADLAEDIRKALSEQHGNDTGSALNEHTLRRLMLAWGVMPKRRFSRSQQSARVSVAMGLAATHYFVSGEAAFSPAGGTLESSQYQERPDFQPEPVQTERGHTPDIWELEPVSLDSQSPIQAPQKHRVDMPGGLESEQKQGGLQAHDWHMINVSAGGYCLLWDRMENSRAQVGELVGIREHDDPDAFHWHLGVVRWMKCNTGLELGVQMLSPGAVAVGARPYPATSREPQFSRVLLLPEIPSLGQPATLLLSSPPFRTGGTAIINSHGREVRVKLDKLVENTGSFAQFQFTTLEGNSSSPQAAEKKRTAAEQQEFDDIWTLI